jgi:hypothetical protein
MKEDGNSPEDNNEKLLAESTAAAKINSSGPKSVLKQAD